MIILLGDYSSVHYELSKALNKKGEKTLLISDGDEYKKIKCDIKIPAIKKYKIGIINKILLLYRFSGLFGVSNYFFVKKEIEKIEKTEKIDVFQIINPVISPSLGALGNILLIRFLKKRNSVLSLCALGDDYVWVNACLKKVFKYSPMDRMYSSGIKGFIAYFYMLKYVYSPLYRYLDFYARKYADIIIPGLVDYKIAYGDGAKISNIINVPIADENFVEPLEAKYPIKIFHAWQLGKEDRKGNDVLDRVIKKYICENGNNNIKYEIVSNVSYDEYLKKYRDSDIILDQVYSYDRGVTGCLGMAAGKVVFSGFENGNFDIGINAIPDEDLLYENLCKTINSLDLINHIKWNAFNYAKKNYKSELVSDKYLEIWHAFRR